MAVVATTLVMEARSNKVAGTTAGDNASYVRQPKASSAMRRSAWVTATEAAGKACWLIASRRPENAEAKRSF